MLLRRIPILLIPIITLFVGCSEDNNILSNKHLLYGTWKEEITLSGTTYTNTFTFNRDESYSQETTIKLKNFPESRESASGTWEAGAVKDLTLSPSGKEERKGSYVALPNSLTLDLRKDESKDKTKDRVYQLKREGAE